MERGISRRRWLTVVVSVGAFTALVLAQGAGSKVNQVGNSTLTVQFSGGGSGTVTQISGPGLGTPNAINCTTPPPGLGNVCTETVPFGAPPQPFIGLQSNAPVGSEFIGWAVFPAGTPTFGCGSASECFVQMNGNVTVIAQFNSTGPTHAPLAVVRGGSGAQLGAVTSRPPGIHCGFSSPDCAASFAIGSTVTLTAATQGGATFAGWGGACAFAGSNTTCSLSMTTARSVTANFNAPQQTLTVTVQGSGGVSGVASSTQAISCPPTCQATFAQGSQVTLYASAAANYSFTGWSGGGCSGQSTCTVTMNAATSVTATFTQITQSLNVDVDGLGSVTSTPAGISCPTDCQGAFPQGSQVTLTATPRTGYQFSDWNGAGCNGTGSCQVTMSQAQAVEAIFTAAPVQAIFGAARVTTNGPPNARRRVTVVTANQEVVGVNIRILRAGAQLKNVTFRRQAVGRHLYPMAILNRVAGGRATVQVTFTNVVGTRKVQVRPITLPRALPRV
jgi:hypothetical protein